MATKNIGLFWHRRSYTRRSLIRGALVGGTGLAVPLLACNSRSPKASGARTASSLGERPQTGGTLNWPQISEIPTLDPNVHTTTVTNDAEYACLCTPFRFKIGPDPKTAEDHDIQNYVAVSAESPDAVTWTVKLRHDVKFHNIAPVNGHQLEPEDVKASYTRALTLPGSTLKGPLGMINPSQIETPDATTVVFKLNYPYAPFAHTLAAANYSQIFPREALAGTYDPAKQVIGSGPFIWDNYTPDVAIALKKNPEYFEQGQPYIDGVRLPIILEAAQQLSQFTAGHLDYLIVVQQNFDTAKQENPMARVLTATSGGNLSAFFQLGNAASPFQDVRLRRAISMAIDRDAIGKVLYNGESSPAFSLKTYMGKWALTMDDLDPDEYIFSGFDSKSADNHDHLQDPKLDAMIAQARTIVDEQGRRKAYLDIQKYIAEQMYNVGGLPAGNDHILVQPTVHNFSYTFNDGNRRDVWSSLWLQR